MSDGSLDIFVSGVSGTHRQGYPAGPRLLPYPLAGTRISVPADTTSEKNPLKFEILVHSVGSP